MSTVAAVLSLWAAGAVQAAIQPAPAAVTSGTTATDGPSSDIVVVGTRIADARAALERCLARRCAPAEEVQASLRLTDAYFLAGDYEKARRVLSRASARNTRYAAQIPEGVADLNRARSTIAAHTGEREWRIREAGRTIDALKAGLSPNDQRVFIERLRLGDTNLRTGRRRSAEQVFEAVAGDARAAGNSYIEAAALLRLGTLYAALARARGAGWGARADSVLARVAALQGPDLAEAKQIAAQLREQMHGNGPKSPADRAVALWTNSAPVDRPVLLYNPPDKEQEAFGVDNDSAEGATAGTANRSSMSALGSSYIPDQWIDVTFWIDTDGTVDDASVSNKGKTTRDFWVDGAVARIKGRRYAPMKERMMRVERITRTANHVGAPGWKIRRRSELIRYVTTDITPS